MKKTTNSKATKSGLKKVTLADLQKLKGGIAGWPSPESSILGGKSIRPLK